jgi:hypothetical protein
MTLLGISLNLIFASSAFGMHASVEGGTAGKAPTIEQHCWISENGDPFVRVSCQDSPPVVPWGYPNP